MNMLWATNLRPLGNLPPGGKHARLLALLGVKQVR